MSGMDLEVLGRDHLLMAIGYLHAELSTELGEVAARLTPAELAEKFDKALKETREDQVLDPLEIGAHKATQGHLAEAPAKEVNTPENIQAMQANEPRDDELELEDEGEPALDDTAGSGTQTPAEKEGEEGGLGRVDPGERAEREHRAAQIEKGADSAFAREKAEREARRAAGGLASDKTSEGFAEVDMGSEPGVSVEAQSGNVLHLVPCQHQGCGNMVPSSKGLINGMRVCVEHEPQPEGGGDGIEIQDL